MMVDVGVDEVRGERSAADLWSYIVWTGQGHLFVLASLVPVRDSAAPAKGTYKYSP